MVLRMALRMGEHLGPARESVGVRLAGPPPKRMTAARRACCAAGRRLVRSKSEVAQEAGVSAGVIDGLIDEGTLETLVLPPEPVARAPDPDHRVPDFTDGAARGGGRLARDRRQGRLLGHADRRRHRLGQDRGLFRGGGRDASGAAGRR